MEQSLSLPHVEVGACTVLADTAARVELAAAVWLALAAVLVDLGAADGRPPPVLTAANHWAVVVGLTET